jgi:hypothetical protein
VRHFTYSAGVHLSTHLVRRNDPLLVLAKYELAVLGEILRLPGIKFFLTRRFHPDRPDINDAECKWLAGAMQKVNAAYEALEKKDGQ